jgi:ribonuclease R
MSALPSKGFLARVVGDRDALMLERCFDPTPSNRVPLIADESLGAGDYVVAEPRGPAARVQERLAAGGTALARVYGLAVSHGLDPLFPERVMADARALLEAPGIDDHGLADLTGLPFCTIDGPGTRDLDQALHVAVQAGGYRLHYALADASWFVAMGSALFEEALSRSSSFYLPGLVIPMLPRPLSEGVCSLNPGVDRRALVMVMDIDGGEAVIGRAWTRARIHSRARLAFDEVIPLMAGGAPGISVDPELRASLKAFRALGEILAARRDREGVVRYRRHEVDMTLGPEGRILIPIREIADPAERWNEEVSVLCNVEGARFLLEGDGPDDGIEPIYRVHPAPPPQRLAELERRIAALVGLHDLDGGVWSWRRDAGEDLAAYLRRLPKEGESGRLAGVIHRQAVVTNLRSTFAAEPAPHAGVGAEVYGRFTAPMREMVGIYLHQETIEKLEGLAPSGSADDRNLRRRVIDGANRARELQARLVKEVNRAAMDAIWTADLALPEAERPRRRGTVMGFRGNKVYCLLDDPPLEVKVYSEDVAEAAGEPVEVDPEGASLRARSDGRILVRLGDSVPLIVSGLDAKRDRWRLSILPG